ncbi:BMP family ABC transporter substrate-binding protein [Caenimonas koreensis DSM 17982]|uniref:BMP family ABC transporter substrate-binding protein n=1 Tax=Caenimonas koreensis DSM 17982 TaxID=1121255 RepID=A0A844B4F0_9BURK|nr:BMP family ABC transporter substrate-binding protein [Caenimonas koreensis]MRD46146.1 BMP family ABC transporter substrate-binding protein [Caenimonas koreensis DSM 17982]
MHKNLVAALAAACLLHTAFAQTAKLPASPTAEKLPLKEAFVFVSPVTDTGWIHQHDEGRRAVEAAFAGRVKTSFVENVAEGADAERVIRDLAQQGNQLIFTPSFGYMEPTMKVAKEFPGVKFESITGYKTAPNVAVANARYYEGRYLAGVLAGRMTKTNVAGYVAGFPIPEVVQGVNAFTLGMRSVNPRAQVKVIWLNAWFDPPREREAALTLFNQEADVVTLHTATDAVMAAAQERGKMAIAYHSDMRKAAPDAQIGAVTHHWGDYYKRRTQAVLDGTWKSGATWGGVKDGMVRIEGFGSKVPQAVQAEVLARQKDIASGKLHPFAGPIDDNEGKAVVAKGQVLGEDQVQTMNWLAAGVVGKIAK